MKKGVTILILAAAVALSVTVPASAKHATTKIEGCEAADMSIVLSSSRTASWEAPIMKFAHWRFTHVVDISCDSTSCDVAGGLRILRGAALGDSTAIIDGDAETERADDRPVLLPSPNDVRDAWELRGHSAREIANAIDSRGFLGRDQRMHFVWLDYGQFNRTISIRGRTEIACDLGGDHCTIATSVLVFIPYNERQRCGYISKETERTGMEPVQQSLTLASTRAHTRPHPRNRG